jgi:hypothetical protein
MVTELDTIASLRRLAPRLEALNEKMIRLVAEFARDNAAPARNVKLIEAALSNVKLIDALDDFNLLDVEVSEVMRKAKKAPDETTSASTRAAVAEAAEDLARAYEKNSAIGKETIRILEESKRGMK